MSEMRKVHKILREIISMNDIATELVSTHPLILTNSKNNGCSLKYKKAYDIKNITNHVKEALLTIINEKIDIIEERFLDVNLPWDISIITKSYIDMNFSICYDYGIKYIYIDYEK